MAAANPRTVVVIMAGSAVIVERWRASVPGIVVLWYPGSEGGRALADVLLGAADPGGRLPFAVPTDPAHLPYFDKAATRIVYDRWHGQRLLDRDGHAPAFPLGFGLSYTLVRAVEPGGRGGRRAAGRGGDRGQHGRAPRRPRRAGLRCVASRGRTC